MNTKQIEKKLGQCAPAVVNVILAGGDSKPLRPPMGTRKRWVPIVNMLARLDWRRLELLDRAGGILDMIDNEDATPGDQRITGDAAAEPGLKTMILAQREALTWQDKSVRAALDTVVQVMQQMHESISMIVELHRQERTQQAALLRDLEEAVQAAAAAQPAGDDQPQAELLRSLAPLLLQKLLTSSKPNGST